MQWYDSISGLMMRFFTLFSAIALCTGLIGATDKLKCKHVPIDLVIVMDESSSIGADDYQTALDAAAGITQRLRIGTTQDDSRVGMVSFSDGGRVRFGLDQYKTNSDVTSAIRRSDYGRGLTNIAAGMHVATTEVFAKAKDRALRKVMLVITDGMDITDVGKEHALAEKAGIVTYVIGVGEETDYEELVKAAGDKKHVFTFANYQALADEIDLVCSSFILGCDCNYHHTWLDLIFIIDSSKAVNEQDFDAVRNFAASFISQIPVSQQIGKFSRVGIINMGDEANVVGMLTSYNSPDEAANAMRSMPYLNSNSANLRDALTKATNMLDSSHDERKNVQNVVVLFSSVDEPCTYQGHNKLSVKTNDYNPCRLASHLKENKNIILTVGLKYDGTQRFPDLEVGSDCYKLIFDTEIAHNFIDAICRANCYCLPPYVQFTDKCTEYGECVYQQGQAVDHQVAQQTCQNYNTAMIDVLSAEKDRFIANMEQKYGYNQYWLGAYYSVDHFEWATGFQMDANDYKHWAPNEPDLKKGDCVYEDSNGWHSDDCNDFMHTHHFLCQKKACNTENYCDFDKLH